MKASTIAAITYDQLKRRLGITTPTKVIDARFMIAAVEDEVLLRLHVDVVRLDLSACAAGAAGQRVDGRAASSTAPTCFSAGHRGSPDGEGNWILLDADS